MEGIICALLPEIIDFSFWGKYHLWCCFDWSDNQNNKMRAFTNRILYTFFYKKNTYGSHSEKYHCIVDLNQLK